jgi:fumarate hydratase class II
MNINEVLANRALELLGEPKGHYQRLSPNDHVNYGQSTNDVIPTAIRMGGPVGLGSPIAPQLYLARSLL